MRRQDIVEQNALPEDLQMTAVVKPSHAKRTYSKEFLLSLSKLEECKRAPVNLDAFFQRDTQAKLEEKGVTIPGAASSRGLIRTVRENDVCAESPPDVPEWRRPSSLPGSPFLKSGSRHAEQKISSPRPGPAQNNNNATKTIMGRSCSARWELHSTGDEQDRDGNGNFFEWESSSATESGGHFHSKGLARSGSVVSQEHDGLLGSGGPIVQRGMLQAHLNDWHRPERVSRIGRTREQYQSTRIGKASRNYQNKQNLGWEDADSVSHETFGLDDQPNGDRSEQERQRRDQFEQMRKELRKKPLNIARNYNDIWLDEGLQNPENLLPSSPGTPHSTSSKEDMVKSFHKSVATSSTPRLLVPPGFSKPILAKENHEAAKHEKDDNMDPLRKTTSNDGAELDNEDHLSSLLSKFNRLEDGNQTFPPSKSPMTSKFAHWFPSHGSDIKDSLSNSGPSSIVTKSEDQDLSFDLSSAEPELAGSNDMRLMNKLRSVTSLMPSNNKGSVLPMPLGPSLEDVEKMMTAGADSGPDLASEVDLNQKNDVMLDDHFVSERDQEVVNDTGEYSQTLDSEGAVTKEITGKKNPPVFLTCEDLEQSFLSESVHSGNQKSLEDMDNNVNLMELLQIGSSENECQKKDQDWDAIEEPGVLDGNASVHLMSLLQKTKGRVSPLEGNVKTMSGQVSEHLVEQNDHQEDQHGTSEISFETLFGREFVNELRAVAEPVSAKQIVDDSRHLGQDDGLQHAVLFNKSHVRRTDLTDVGFNEQVGWKHNGHVVSESEGPEIMSGRTLQYMQDNLLAEALANNQTSMKATKNLPPSRGFSGNGASFGNIRHRNVSNHPYWAHEQHHPTSEVLSHSLHLKPIQEPHLLHDTSIHGMGMYAPNSHVYRAFPGAGSSHLPEHFEEGSSVFRGTYGMPCSVPAGYHESMQMGFNSSQCFPNPRSSGARMRPVAADRWFPGDQAFQGFHPYQHLMTHERKPRPGVSGLGIGPGVQNYNLAMPSDSLGQPEISYDHYTLSRARPGYG